MVVGGDRRPCRSLVPITAVQTLVHECTELELYPFRHSQPMKLLQQRRNMIIPRSSVNHGSRCIDSRLKPIELVSRQSGKNSVAVIQPCQDQRHYQSVKPVSILCAISLYKGCYEVTRSQYTSKDSSIATEYSCSHVEPTVRTVGVQLGGETFINQFVDCLAVCMHTHTLSNYWKWLEIASFKAGKIA